MSTTPLPESLWGRLRGTVRGFFVGLAMLGLAFPLLLWNESGAILNAQSVDSRADQVISVVTDPVQSVNDGRLVHMTGQLSPVSTIVDPEFGLSLPVLKLQRQVDVYQWVESPGEAGKEPVYARAWLSELVDSSKFQNPEQHRNPTSLRFGSWESYPGHARLGAFDLPQDLIDSYNPFVPVALTPEDLKSLTEPIRKESRLHSGMLYFSASPQKPNVGDVRVRYIAVRSGPVSVIARQTENTLAPFYTQTGFRIYRLRAGEHPADVMYRDAAPGSLMTLSDFLTWLIRSMAWVMMALGILIALERGGPWVETMPIVRDFLAPGSRIFAAGISAALVLATVGFAWLSYSWLKAGFFVALAAGVLVLLHRHGHGLRNPAAGR